MRICLIFLLFCAMAHAAPGPELRTWRAVRGFTIQARFVSYEDGLVTLRRHDGQIVTVRVEQLTPRDRDEVQRWAGAEAQGTIPAGSGQPEGRRTLTWQALRRGDPWHPAIRDSEKGPLLRLSRSWSHAESQHFIVHYLQTGYARTVARQADFFYDYITADLRGLQDRDAGKSSIVVLRNSREWDRFLEESKVAPEWASAFVMGPVMYLYDFGANQSRLNSHVLAHEISHLVLNRFFVRDPPLWLNEGLAEWYGSVAWKAFQGQRVNPRNELGPLPNPYPLDALLSARMYPERPEEIARFYETSHHLVGFLMQRKDTPAFVRFLSRITVENRSLAEALREVYEFNSLDELKVAFLEFVR